MKKVRKNGLSGATAIVTPLIFLMSLATRRLRVPFFMYGIDSLCVGLYNRLVKIFAEVFM